VPFYLVDAFNYWVLRISDWEFHSGVTLILLAWALVSVGCQRLMRRPEWQSVVPFAWGACDVLALFGLLFIGDGVISPLLIGLPLLVVGAGFWFRVRLVWFMTVLTSSAYISLTVVYHLGRPDLQKAVHLDHDDHIFFVAGLTVMGAAVAYQVQRVRSLSRYYDSMKR
jgi:hypothetical protein